MKRQVGFALVGCGHIANKHAQLLANHLEKGKLIAVCDRVATKAEKLGQLYFVPWFTDVHKMLDIYADKIDVINILTPTGYHEQNVMELVPYKKHLCVEKPLTLTLESADRIINACEKANIHLFVIKQNRFNLPVQQLFKAVKNNRLGKLIFLSAKVYWCRDQNYYDQAQWRGTLKLDGGVFANQASHHLDLLQWIGGEVESLVAKGIRQRQKNIETEDTGAVLLKFRSGALGVVEVTTASPFNLEGSIRVLGTEGIIEISGNQTNHLQIWKMNDSSPVDEEVWHKYKMNPPDIYGFAHREYFKSVIQTILNGTPPAVDGCESVKSLKIFNAIYQSISTGKEIFLS